MAGFLLLTQGILYLALALSTAGVSFSIGRVLLEVASTIRHRLAAATGEGAAEAASAATRAAMPASLQSWIQGESEEFAQEDLTQEAVELYASLSNWQEVEETLRRRHGASSVPEEEAAARAWSRPTVLPQPATAVAEGWEGALNLADTEPEDDAEGGE